MNLKILLTLFALAFVFTSASTGTLLWVYQGGDEYQYSVIDSVENIRFEFDPPTLVINHNQVNGPRRFEIETVDRIEFDFEPYSVEEMDKLSNILNSFRLISNHPNPFNPSTDISYDLTKSGEVTIIIYDVMGKEIITLLSDHQGAGSYQTNWDGTNSDGIKVAAGMYFYQLTVDGSAETKKMLLLR